MTTTSRRKRKASTKKPANTITPVMEVKAPPRLDEQRIHPDNGDLYSFSIIPRKYYLYDFKNRWNIHKYETRLLGRDIMWGYNKLTEYGKLLITKLKDAAP